MNRGSGGVVGLRAQDASRSVRVRKPTAKALAVQQMVEDIEEQETGANDEISSKEGKQIVQILTEQIKSVLEELKASKEEIKASREEAKASRQEVKELRSWIETNSAAWTSPQPSTNSGSTPSSWPSLQVPRSGLPSQKSISPHSSASNQGPAIVASVGIDLTKVDCRKEEPSMLKKRFNNAFTETVAINRIKCTGILKSPGEAHKAKLLFKTQSDADLVRANEDWLKAHFRGARLQGEQWYPIKVDRVNRYAINDGNSWNIRQSAAKEIGEENRVEIARMRWLSGPSDKHFGSLVVYLTKQKDAGVLLENQLMDFKGEAAFTSVFQRRQVPSRCFKCQKYGHQEFRCKDETVCAKCATTGHTEKDCISPETKCAACKGPHKASDRGCKVYRDLLNKMNPNNGQSS